MRAFDAHAVDYLLKPFEESRFTTALSRALQRLEGPERLSPAGWRRTIAELRAPAPIARAAFWSRRRGRVLVVPADEIEWVEAADNYVRLHTRQRSWMLRESMQEMELQLCGNGFARAHRSAIVNLARVRELQPLFGGEYSRHPRLGRARHPESRLPGCLSRAAHRGVTGGAARRARPRGPRPSRIPRHPGVAVRDGADVVSERLQVIVREGGEGGHSPVLTRRARSHHLRKCGGIERHRAEARERSGAIALALRSRRRGRWRSTSRRDCRRSYAPRTPAAPPWTHRA